MSCCELYAVSLRHHVFSCERWCARANKADYATETIATAVFTRTDGKTVTLDHVSIDSIGPAAERPGVVGVEFTNDPDRVVHLPFIESWEISYRFV